MTNHLSAKRSPPRTLHYVLLCSYLVLLTVAGGASRADEAGQIFARGAAVLVLIWALLIAARPSPGSARWVLYFLLTALALAMAQLIPLPSSVWMRLPGRAMLAAATLGEHPWRPLSMVPGDTVNAAASLVVPLAVLAVTFGLRADEHDRLPGVVLGLVAMTMIVGALQFAGTPIDNPLVNDRLGAVAGLFANRNHFALFMALGCVIAPVWAFSGRERAAWRGPVALGLVTLFLLLILASGSRAGVLLGILGLGLGAVIARDGVKRRLVGAPRWLKPVAAVAILGIVAIVVLLSIGADRAESFKRAVTVDVNGDMRVAALPTVFQMVKTYFPVGTGFGSFDTVFRIHEPFALLKPTHFNRAHDDVIEVVLDGGLPALLLLIAVFGWWVQATVRVWHNAVSSGAVVLGRLGSAVLFLILISSLVDYAARTPIIMAVVVIAASWLAWGARPTASPWSASRAERR